MSLPNFDLNRGAPQDEDSAVSSPTPASRRLSRTAATSRRQRREWKSALGLRPSTTGLNLLALMVHATASILFLVFINAIQPFYISQLDSQTHRQDPAEPPELRIGLLTGKLVFSDELVSIALVLLWGSVAERYGIGLVATTGYCLIAAGLMAYACAQKPWPDLLWCRLIFAGGGSAVTAMLTGQSSRCSDAPIAPIPVLKADVGRHGLIPSPTTACFAAYSDDSFTAKSSQTELPEDAAEASEQTPLLPGRPASEEQSRSRPRHGVLASFAGLLTGLGAIVAVFGLLPLPVWLASLHASEGDPSGPQDGNGGPQDPHVQKATRETFLIAACLSLLVAAIVGIGLRDPRNASKRADRRTATSPPDVEVRDDRPRRIATREARRARLRARLEARAGGGAFQSVGAARAAMRLSLMDLSHGLFNGFKLAWHDSSGKLALAYVGGGLARGVTIASTVFLPLLIAHYFYTTDPTLCPPPSRDLPPSDLKRTCRRAYTLTAAQSGILQTSALVCAPLVGIATDRFGGHVVLGLGAALGFGAFLVYGAFLPGEGDPRVAQAWIAAVLLGATQISAIVCSLSLTAQMKHVLTRAVGARSTGSGEDASLTQDADDSQEEDAAKSSSTAAGSVAGAYSATGALSILLLSSIGGWLFDLRPSGPFLILAGWSGVVALWAGVVIVRERINARGMSAET